MTPGRFPPSSRRAVAAIRLYQQFAGLPPDGAPTVALLEDLREITKTLKTDIGTTAGR